MLRLEKEDRLSVVLIKIFYHWAVICVRMSSLTGCLAAATAAAAAAAFIAPALGYIPASNTRAHGLQHTISKTGHSTHSTGDTQQHRIHARTPSQSHATNRC